MTTGHTIISYKLDDDSLQWCERLGRKHSGSITHDLTKRRELELRVTVLEKLVKEIRALEDERRRKAGPQQLHDAPAWGMWRTPEDHNGNT